MDMTADDLGMKDELDVSAESDIAAIIKSIYKTHNALVSIDSSQKLRKLEEILNRVDRIDMDDHPELREKIKNIRERKELLDEKQNFSSMRSELEHVTNNPSRIISLPEEEIFHKLDKNYRKGVESGGGTKKFLQDYQQIMEAFDISSVMDVSIGSGTSILKGLIGAGASTIGFNYVERSETKYEQYVVESGGDSIPDSDTPLLVSESPPAFYVKTTDDGKDEMLFAYDRDKKGEEKKAPLGIRVETEVGPNSIDTLREKYKDNENISVAANEVSQGNLVAHAYEMIDFDPSEYKQPREPRDFELDETRAV